MPVPKGTRVGGRQKGTPNKATAEIKALTAQHAPAIVKELVRLATKAKNEATRVAAAGQGFRQGASGTNRRPQDPVGSPDRCCRSHHRRPARRDTGRVVCKTIPRAGSQPTCSGGAHERTRSPLSGAGTIVSGSKAPNRACRSPLFSLATAWNRAAPSQRRQCSAARSCGSRQYARSGGGWAARGLPGSRLRVAEARWWTRRWATCRIPARYRKTVHSLPKMSPTPALVHI